MKNPNSFLSSLFGTIFLVLFCIGIVIYVSLSKLPALILFEIGCASMFLVSVIIIFDNHQRSLPKRTFIKRVLFFIVISGVISFGGIMFYKHFVPNKSNESAIQDLVLLAIIVLVAMVTELRISDKIKRKIKS